RQAYRLIELQRWSEYLGLPMHIQPTFFPVAPDLASKMVIAAQLSNGTEASLTLAGAILRGLWAEQKNIADADTLVGVAFDCELDGKALLKSADTASVQAELDRFTNEANSANVFGAPWYVYQGEGYWGQDRLDFLERAFQKS
ncbi:MAG: DsbA family protein, partial [Burkholderiaceae bacterium]|nr:DsbA family protein [Burkholderiaceae bacterium]